MRLPVYLKCRKSCNKKQYCSIYYNIEICAEFRLLALPKSLHPSSLCWAIAGSCKRPSKTLCWTSLNMKYLLIHRLSAATCQVIDWFRVLWQAQTIRLCLPSSPARLQPQYGAFPWFWKIWNSAAVTVYQALQRQKFTQLADAISCLKKAWPGADQASLQSWRARRGTERQSTNTATGRMTQDQMLGSFLLSRSAPG